MHCRQPSSTVRQIFNNSKWIYRFRCCQSCQLGWNLLLLLNKKSFLYLDLFFFFCLVISINICNKIVVKGTREHYYTELHPILWNSKIIKPINHISLPFHYLILIFKDFPNSSITVMKITSVYKIQFECRKVYSKSCEFE